MIAKFISVITMAMMAAIAFATSLMDGLVAYWPFDSNANDISGNGNNGSVYDATLTADRFGNLNSAYHFTGASWIEVASSSSLRNITSSITIAAWIKPTKWFVNSTGNDMEFISILQKGGHFQLQFGKRGATDSSTPKNYIWLNYPGGICVDGDDLIKPTIGSWQFIAATYDGQKMKIYKNGRVCEEVSIRGSLNSSDDTLCIGKDPVERCEYFVGDMDNVSIYDRALSSSEIKALAKFIPSILEIQAVSFNSNGGIGEMEDEVFESGKGERLPKNTYHKDGYVFQGWAVAADGEVVYKDEALITVDSDMTLYAVWAIAAQSNTHNKVQLWAGGPYWADRNIGADKPEDYGLYFWWGDTTGHSPSGGKFSFNFDYDNPSLYTFGRSVEELQSAGWVTSDGVLAPSHDAAHVKWGGGWRMPTRQELYDLCYNKCDWLWTTTNGVNGYVVRGRGSYASNSIFLPCAGRGYGTSFGYADSYGYYWSSIPYSDNTYSFELYFDSGYHDTRSYYRNLGRSIRPVQGLGQGDTYGSIVVFNANGGTGAMENQTFEDGKEQKLSKNVYRKDGYVFQGWAVAADGEVVYKDEALITVDSDMTLYAVWDNPPLTLTAESADWSSGSITLRCENLDMGATAYLHLYYYDVAKKQWCDIDRSDFSIYQPSEEMNESGDMLTVARITDMKFSERNNGVGTVIYRVEDGSGRGDICETRSRYGIFVAVDEYQDPSLSYLSTVKHEAAVFMDAYVKYGKGVGQCLMLNMKPKKADVLSSLNAMAEKVLPGDIFLFYFIGHGGQGYVCCNDCGGAGDIGRITADGLSECLRGFCEGAGLVAIIYSCHSESMFMQDNNSLNGGRVGWIVSSQAEETTWSNSLTSIVFGKGWFEGLADIHNGRYGNGNGDGYVSFDELAQYGFEFTAANNYHGHGQQMLPKNTFILDHIIAGKIPANDSAGRKWIFLTKSPSLFSSSNGDVSAAESMIAANGCRTVGECYALGIDPEDPDDDFKVTHFEMKDGKPVITLNHTEDGSGNSFLPRVKTLGKADLSDAEWHEVPEEGNSEYRFFTISVDAP